MRPFLLCGIQGGHRCGGTPGGRDAEQSARSVVRVEQNSAVAGPGTAHWAVRVAQGQRRPAGDVDLLQLALGKEADEPAVGRPERKHSTFSTWKHLRFSRVERPNR